MARKWVFQLFKLPVIRTKFLSPLDLDDDTEGYSWSRIKTLNYASYTELVRMVKILRFRRPEGLAYPRYYFEVRKFHGWPKWFFSREFRLSPTLQIKANILILFVGYMNVSYEKHKHGNLTTTTTSLLLLTTKIFFYKNNILLNVLNLLFVWFEVPKCSYRVYFFLV